eukprot:4168928-Pleurochrysis_carterae.AAC.1
MEGACARVRSVLAGIRAESALGEGGHARPAGLQRLARAGQPPQRGRRGRGSAATTPRRPRRRSRR